jgi:hypothetical protein
VPIRKLKAGTNKFPIQEWKVFRKVKDNSAGWRNWTALKLPARARAINVLIFSRFFYAFWKAKHTKIKEVAMQLDMHFYGVYALARAAGIKAETAKAIADASQFVDDAIEDEAIVLSDQRAVIPTMTSHKPLDYHNTIPGDQWKVWVPFHFLPANDENATTFVEKMVCHENSPNAREMLNHALRHKEELFGPHLVGISAHVYADTFAHYGFVGLARDRNRVKSDSIKVHVESSSILNYIRSKFEAFKSRLIGTAAEIVPVGHGAVATYPDRPYLDWEYKYETGEPVERKNVDDFTKACHCLHAFFSEFVNNNNTHGDPVNPQEWTNIEDKVRDILEQEAPKEERIELWKHAISHGLLFPAKDDDNHLGYSKNKWKSARIVEHFAAGGNERNCDGCLYIRAALKHRDYILHNLLPISGVIAY